MEMVLDVLFPPVCVGCRRVGRWVCPSCWVQVPWLIGNTCPRCRRPSLGKTCLACDSGGAVDSVVAVADFDGVVKETVHAFKYMGRHAIASVMAALMADALSDVQAEFVVPVPLHRRRRRERGYDQAVLLARKLAKIRGLKCAESALVRARHTDQQALLNPQQRRDNVAGAFTPRSSWQHQSIILIDDVATTGATLAAAGKCLKQAGAGEITGLVFAHPLIASAHAELHE